MDDVSTGLPMVSVLMAACNAESTIAEAVDSVLRQTYPNLELIVVDDGSTDRTAAILATYGERIRVMSQANCGLSSARNAGCRAARGDFFALMDADDRCAPQRINAQMAVMRQFEDVALCSTEFSAFDLNGVIAERFARQYYSMLGDTPNALNTLFPRAERVTAGGDFSVRLGSAYPDLAFGNFLHPPTLLFPRSTFEAAGPFDQTLCNHADWEWIVRAARTGQVAYVDVPLLEYRISSTQRSASSRRVERAGDLQVVITKIWNADPAPPAGMKPRRHALLAALWLDVADALSEDDKWKAMKYLGQSTVLHRGAGVRSVKVFLKILTPLSLLRTLRRIRGRDETGAMLPP